MYFIYEAITDHYKKTAATRYINGCRNRGPAGVTSPINVDRVKKTTKQQPIIQKSKPKPKQSQPQIQPSFQPKQIPLPVHSKLPISELDRPIRQPLANRKQQPLSISQPHDLPALTQYQPEITQQPERPLQIYDSKLSKNEFMVMETQERPIHIPKKPAFQDEQPEASQKLYECPEGCGRSFNKKALEKHAKVCKKVFQQKRKQFSAAEQRQIEQAKQIVVPAPKKSKIQPPKVDSSKPKWAQESLALRANIKKSKNIPLTPQQEQALKQPAPDMIQCNFCSRRFNRAAAEKHIPFCEKKSKKK